MKELTRKVLQHDGQKPATSLTLPWHKRTRSRQRVVLDNGMNAGLFLERGTVLRGGDLLANDRGFTVAVISAPESLSTVECTDALQLARLCYHLGNRHVNLQISVQGISYPHDHVLDKMIRGLGFEPIAKEAPFEPESGAYREVASAHSHGHSHE